MNHEFDANGKMFLVPLLRFNPFSDVRRDFRLHSRIRFAPYRIVVLKTYNRLGNMMYNRNSVHLYGVCISFIYNTHIDIDINIIIVVLVLALVVVVVVVCCIRLCSMFDTISFGVSYIYGMLSLTENTSPAPIAFYNLFNITV